MENHAEATTEIEDIRSELAALIEKYENVDIPTVQQTLEKLRKLHGETEAHLRDGRGKAPHRSAKA